MSHPDPAVAISVVIASYNARRTIRRSLEALRDQQTDIVYEVIVVDSSADGTADVIERSHPEVNVIRCDERRFAGHARNIGIVAARGEILALTDADCVAAPDWIESVWRAHEQPHPVIGGVVDNANPESYVGWGYYFCEFNLWRPGTPAGFVDDIPGCCLTLKRSAFDRWGPFVEGTYCSDTVFHWRLTGDGERPFLDPSLRVAHINPDGLGGQWSHGLLHGSHFAQMRVLEQRPGAGKLISMCVLAPLLSPILFGRLLLRFPAIPTYFGRFLLSSPIVLANQTAWAWGEWRGYLAGLRSALRTET